MWVTFEVLPENCVCWELFYMRYVLRIVYKNCVTSEMCYLEIVAQYYCRYLNIFSMAQAHCWLILEFFLNNKSSCVHFNDMLHLHSSRYLLPPPPSVASRSRPFSKPPSNIPSAAHSKVPSKNPTPIPESPVQPIARNSPVIRPASKAQTPPAKSPTVKTPRQETPAEKKTLDAVLDIVANVSNSFKRGNNHLLAVNFLCAWLLIQCAYLQYIQYLQYNTHTYNTMQ